MSSSWRFFQVKITRGEEREKVSSNKDFMRDLLNIVWWELEKVFHRKGILTKPKFSILKS